MHRMSRAALKGLAVSMVAGAIFGLRVPSTTASSGYDQTYTSDADFGTGTLFNVNHDAPNGNQLQLDENLSTFPVMWVANGGEDTVSKIDTDGNIEVGRYRSWYPNPGGHYPHGAWTGPAPSRTAVDADGNAYVLNRHFGPNSDFQAATLPASVMKILATGFIDRNGNGVMDTSTNSVPMPMGPDINKNGVPDSDTDGDGIPDDGEIKDERIAWIKQVGPVNGLGRAICIGTDGNAWVGLFNAKSYYKIQTADVNGTTTDDGVILGGPVSVAANSNGRVGQPYGCAIDNSGRLWGANIADFISEIDTATGAFAANRVHGGQNYGITVGNNLVYVADLSGGREWRTWNPTTNAAAFGPAGNSITVSLNGAGTHLFVGGQNGSTRKYALSGGGPIWSAPPSAGGLDSRGTIIDSDGNVWRIHRSNNTIAKYDGTTGALLTVLPVGAQPYTYSDASGLTAISNTQSFGTWTVTQDSGYAGTLWDTVTWNAESQGSTPAGSSIAARVRAADNAGMLASLSWTPVVNGVAISGITGRYIQVEMRLNAATNGDTPILSDVRVQGHAPNSAPTANAGPDQNLICNAACQGEVHLDASGSTDPDKDELTYEWSGPFGTVAGAVADVLVPRGTHTITLKVTDPAGESSEDTLVVTAVDVTAPTLVAPASITVSQGAACGLTPVSLAAATATDACGPTTVASDAPAAFPVGSTVVTFTATDSSGNVSTASATVTVVDTTAPSIDSVTPNTTTLWPPNHQMVPVTVSWTFTDCDATTACQIVSVASSEPANSIGDGNTEVDYEIVSNNTVRLRAERQGPNAGRVYTITVRCTDAAGNSTDRTTTVTVPHDQRPSRR
jgi:hypothetical protein